MREESKPAIDFKSQVIHLTRLIESGDPVQAMELFYHEEVTMQENQEPPRTGKQICIAQEKKHLSRVSSMSSKLINQAINPETQVVFSEWEIEFTNLEGKSFRLCEVSVQQWTKGLVIREQFYYKEIQLLNS